MNNKINLRLSDKLLIRRFLTSLFVIVILGAAAVYLSQPSNLIVLGISTTSK